ncbi:hypothetical protein [Rhizobium laguerreae]|uniref:hypothetical protein n=1 Tax=Rhizobium laguerreae TaxID=1076926 RepID=UPI001441141F|nr:hypothetical protein [Rhizobium laguerreae]NKM36338.1 hypothetical protein [Rhizobium laguerreae]
MGIELPRKRNWANWMHKEYYHWSEAPVSCFYSWADRGRGRFVSNVQGVAFATRKLKWGIWSTTRAIKAKTLLVFVGDAAERFRTYEALKFDGFFKRPLGQHTTDAQGDLVWNEEDAVVVGNVIIVGKMEIREIVDDDRLKRLEKERKKRRLGWPMFGLLVPFVFLLWWLDNYAGDWFEPHKPIVRAIALLIGGAYVLFFAFSVVWTIVRSSKPDIAQDLKVARKQAQAKGLYSSQATKALHSNSTKV